MKQSLFFFPASESFFNEIAGLRPATLFKKRLWHRCFPENFANFSRTPFIQNTSEQLPLPIHIREYITDKISYFTRCTPCFHLTLSSRRSLSYRNEPIDLQIKSMNWVLYHRDVRHERVKLFANVICKVTFLK